MPMCAPPRRRSSTDVSGIVAAVPVHEGQHVKKGDVLLRLDPRQFQIALDWRQGEPRRHRVSTLNAMKLDYQRMLRDVEVKQAQVQSDQANFDRYCQPGEVRRRHPCRLRQRALPACRQPAGGDGAEDAWPRCSLPSCGGDPDVDVRTMPEYLQAKARVDEAQRQLDHAVIYAPFDGIVTQVDTVQPGMYLAASTAAFGIVSTEDVWVEANPKETELTWVKPGDPVRCDGGYLSRPHLEGRGGEHRAQLGSEFSVLPAQNTSGNWVKVVQRIPVRIKVERKPGDPELRAGMSVEADIDTGHRRTLADLF